ncbi:MAG: MFS transporter [Alphaproteobacteria bacterium]|nr:MFS transporter [Alphaproteobacteria bacterium]
MDRRTKVVIATLSVPTLTLGTDFTGALMLIIPIEREFGADITTTQWVLNIYALTFAMGMVTAGRLADRYGRRRLLVIGLTVFVLASLACAAAQSVGWLIGARAIQGVGSAILWPCILGIASNAAGDDDRGVAIGVLIAVVTSGNVVGPVFAGIVGGLGEWRLFYTANLVMGAISILLVLRCLPSDTPDKTDEPIDYAGIAVLSTAILALLYALDVGGAWGWGSAALIGLLVLAAVSFAAFPVIEKRVAGPLVPPPMMRNRQFLLALSANGLCIPAVFLLFLYLPRYFHKALGWSDLMAAIGTLPLMVCLSATSLISGRFYNSAGPRLLLSVGYGLTVLGTLAVILSDPSWGYAGTVPAMLLLGIGPGLCVGTAGTAAVGAADPSRASLAGALSFMFHLGLGAIGVAGATAIMSGIGGAKLQHSLTAMDVTLSAADRVTLDGSAAGTQASQAILGKFSPETAGRITDAVRDAFMTGFHASFWLAFALAIAGVGAILALDEKKLVNVDR